MAKYEEIQSRITYILAERAHVETPSPTTDLIETGRLDSLMLVELIVGIEEEFGIQVPLEAIEIDHFRSVKSMTDFVTKQVQLVGTETAG